MAKKFNLEEIQRMEMEELNSERENSILVYDEFIQMDDKEVYTFAAYESPKMFFIDSYESGQFLIIIKDDDLSLDFICRKQNNDTDQCEWEINILNSDGHRRTVNFKNSLNSDGFKKDFIKMVERLSILGKTRIKWEGMIPDDIKEQINEKING